MQGDLAVVAVRRLGLWEPATRVEARTVSALVSDLALSVEKAPRVIEWPAASRAPPTSSLVYGT